MAKTLTVSKITTRAERSRLQTSEKPYWKDIDPENHLGYRKGKRGGSWLVRLRIDGRYRQEPLGTSDDVIQEGTLDYATALKRAKEVIAARRIASRAASGGAILTIRSAVEAYIAKRDARDTARNGRPTRSDASIRLSRYVVGQAAVGKRKAVEAAPLASLTLHDLEESDLIDWRSGLPETLKSSTIQRLTNDLKAALNEAYVASRSRLPASLPTVIKHGLRKGDWSDDSEDDMAREDQILSDRQVGLILSSALEIDAERDWRGDLYRLVLVLAATGSRFSQVIRMRVGDVQLSGSRLMVPNSRKGRGGKNPVTPVPVGQDVLEELRPIVADRPAHELLLERWHSKQVPGTIKRERTIRGPWRRSDLVRPWDAIRNRAGLPHLVAYCLRYSSIVRGIRYPLPIHLVASVHDTSVGMIERHYGRYIADGLDELVAKAVVPLVPQQTSGPETAIHPM